MAKTVKEAVAEKIGVTGQSKRGKRRGWFRPWFVVPSMLLMGCIATFFVVRRIFNMNEK